MKLSRIWLKWLAINIARLVLALTLLFSGWTKAIDPMGMVYKLKAYTDYLGWDVADENIFLKIAAGALAFLECYMGLNLFLGARRKQASLMAFCFMLAMTVVSCLIYIYNPVQDCGCFGSFVELTHQETLIKNIVLLLLSFAVVCYPRRMRRFITEKNQWITSIYSTCFIFGLVVYSFHYSPLISFTDYKVGLNLVSAYHGEVGADQKILETVVNFVASDEEGNDVTEQIINNNDTTFLLVLPNITNADDSSADEINELYDYAHDNGYQFIALTASPSSEYSSWIDKTGAVYPIYASDEQVLKAMGRSNPSMLLIMNGYVSGMWGKNELPTHLVYSKLENQHIATNDESMISKTVNVLMLYLLPLLGIIFIDGLWVGNKIFRHKRYMRKLKKETNKDIQV